MLGLYDVESNRESGDGRPDIIVYPQTLRDKVIVIECKYTDNENKLVQSSEEAAKQIITSKYKEGIVAKGYKQIIGYGISFCQKKCYVTKV